MAKPMLVEDETFQDEILDYEGVVFVDCWAAWCAPCRILEPIVNELAEDYEGKAKVAKLNVDENQISAQNYGIMSIPTMLIFKNGQEVDRLIGVMPKELIAERLDKWIT